MVSRYLHACSMRASLLQLFAVAHMRSHRMTFALSAAFRMNGNITLGITFPFITVYIACKPDLGANLEFFRYMDDQNSNCPGSTNAYF